MVRWVAAIGFWLGLVLLAGCAGEEEGGTAWDAPLSLNGNSISTADPEAVEQRERGVIRDIPFSLDDVSTPIADTETIDKVREECESRPGGELIEVVAFAHCYTVTTESDGWRMCDLSQPRLSVRIPRVPPNEWPCGNTEERWTDDEILLNGGWTHEQIEEYNLDMDRLKAVTAYMYHPDAIIQYVANGRPLQCSKAGSIDWVPCQAPYSAVVEICDYLVHSSDCGGRGYGPNGS